MKNFPKNKLNKSNNLKIRKTWGSLSPVTKVLQNKKISHQRKPKFGKTWEKE